MMLADLWLVASALSAALVAVHIAARRGQKMWIMDIVWPVTALWAGPIGAWAYFRLGRGANKGARVAKDDRGVAQAIRATTHCGAGCTLGDLVAVGVAVAAPLVIAGYEIFGEWIVGFVAAFAIGIAFQYFTIKPMRHLSRRDGLVAAVKADALSLTAWQLGMYGWMAIARFAILGHPFDKASPVFWVLMQIAMLAGFLTSLPVNVLMLRRGLKERM